MSADKPNPIPLCPALLAVPFTIIDGAGNPATIPLGSASPSSAACIGSRCAKWVPEVHHAQTKSNHAYFSLDIVDCEHRRTTGRGWCADNLRRAPFADPAGGAS